LFDAHVENAMLKIKLAKAEATHAVTESIHHHENTQRDVADAVTDGANQLEAQKRDVQDTVKDGSHQLEKQATQMSVQNMQAQHKQQMSQANKPKPKK
jgi:urease gamma subunit